MGENRNGFADRQKRPIGDAQKLPIAGRVRKNARRQDDPSNKAPAIINTSHTTIYPAAREPVDGVAKRPPDAAARRLQHASGQDAHIAEINR
jgi:hypothetical protein